VDSKTGQMTGSLSNPGEHIVTLRAKNILGINEKTFKIVVGENNRPDTSHGLEQLERLSRDCNGR